MKIVREDKVVVKLNDKIGSYFPTSKEVRQGDPLLPLPIKNARLEGWFHYSRNA